jgi:MHS family proline/betaine transporter-like MFS transporter
MQGATQTKLTKEQKQAVGLLSIGTFLEYFDLMLFVHMAIILNELFFPKYDPHMTSLLAAFAFCSTYLLRPVGALIFGYIGDRYGRKNTVILTTFMMSSSCLVMAFIPTYNEIGLTATYAIIICRIV